MMAHETPGDLRVRALPSPVCTAWAGSQSRWQEMVTDSGECPAPQPYLPAPPTRFITLCPHPFRPSRTPAAAQLLPTCVRQAKG